MIMCSDGTRFDGRLAKGQVWIKGKTERTITHFDTTFISYRTKSGKLRINFRNSFRVWIQTGAILRKGDDNV